MLALGHQPVPSREPHVYIQITGPSSRIAPESCRPVIGDGISIVVESGGDVIRKARACGEDDGGPETLGQAIEPNEVQLMAAVIIGASPVGVRVIVVSGAGSHGACAIERPRQCVVANELKLAELAAIGYRGAVPPGRCRRLELVNSVEVWIRRDGRTRERSVDITRAVKFHTADGTQLQREKVLSPA